MLHSFFMIIGLYAMIWAKAVDLELEEIKPDIVVELLQESFKEQEF